MCLRMVHEKPGRFRTGWKNISVLTQDPRTGDDMTEAVTAQR